jgi:hypothetical protein
VCNKMIETKFQWIDALTTLCPLIGRLNLKAGKDIVYAERAHGILVSHNTDAYNLSNSDAHNQLVARAVEALSGKIDDSGLRHMLGELTSRTKTYGSFCELAAYDRLTRAGLTPTPQITMTAAEVLNSNGSVLDGNLMLGSKIVFFDIKAFGFHAHKIKILNDRLNAEFPGKSVLVEGAWDVSIELLQDLLEHSGFTQLVADLKGGNVVTRGPLSIRTQDRRPVTVSIHEANPKELAQQNRTYPLRFAGQYTRGGPFLLLFVIHPWFSQGELHQNFGGFVDTFARELARLVFLGFRHDATPLEGMPTSDAVKLLSAIAFLNVWPEEMGNEKRPSCRVYLNPIAVHPLERSDFASTEAVLGDDILIERINDDMPPE